MKFFSLTPRTTSLPPTLILVPWSIIAAAVAWLYWPGLHSTWFLDDYPNLGTLEIFGASPSFADLVAYTFTGLSRPLANFSFALQHTSWPTHPEHFKAVNLAIHFLNGILIWRLASVLLKLNGNNQHPQVFALATAALWLTNPLQVSTVLYAVQRMTEMASFFTLAGLIVWIHLRKTDRLIPQAAALWGFGLLALACKENGVLILLYSAVLAHTVLPRNDHSPRWHEAVLLWLPLTAVLLVVVWHLDSWIIQRYAERPFSLEERLLSQPRALLDYLRTAFVPAPTGLGVYQDDWPASSSLWSPWSTLPAILALAAGTGLALWRRKNFAAFAVLWFLAGHALESTIIPLELYFNHRNYLALFGPLLALSHFAAKRRVTLALLVGWGSLVAFLTYTETRMWGQPDLQARIWQREHPQSPRSAEQLANILARQGRYGEAALVFQQLDRLLPHDDATAALALYHLSCEDSSIPAPPELNPRLAEGNCSVPTLNTLKTLTQAVEDHRCTQTIEIANFIRLLTSNPACTKQKSGLLTMLGRIQMTSGNLAASLKSLEESYRLHPYPPTAMLMTRYLFEAGHLKEAQATLELALHSNQTQPLLRQKAFDSQIKSWQKRLKEALKNRGPRSSDPEEQPENLDARSF